MIFLLIGLIIPLLVAIWVASDAKKKGYTTGVILGWFIGVWFLLIVFLPLYLILRFRRFSPPDKNKTVQVCPYCGKLFKENSNFCPYCGEKLE